MIPSTHYYVLSLAAERGELYEAFRDALIGVENQGFPTTPPISASALETPASRLELMRAVDECFDFYDSRERLGLVVVGDAAHQFAFNSVTTHANAIIGRVTGDRVGTRMSDLGPMVWPVVKELISGVHGRAMHELDAAARDGRVVSGMDAVVVAAGDGALGTLLVEDDYHVRGSLSTSTRPTVLTPDVDIRDVNDDAVDAVIELVLASGGNVVFMPAGFLAERERIVLLLREMSEP